MSESIETVLRLVAEGRLTAEEAAPILDALDAGAAGPARPVGPEPPRAPAGVASERGPSTLRIEVRDQGRQTVNLRLPLALGRFAMDRVPGLTGAHAERIREALLHNVKGPVVEVDEQDGSSVRIVLE